MSDVEGVSPLQRAQEARMRARQAQEARSVARQAASKTSFVEEAEEAFNPFAAEKETQFKSLKERRETAKKPDVSREQLMEASEEAWETALNKEQQNWELSSRTLRDLRNRFLAGDPTAEEILAEVMEAFDDPSLAEEAMEYLAETTYGRTKEEISEAHDRLMERYGETDVKAGRNMGPESREYAYLDSPKMLRNLYRDIVGRPREHNELFKELSSKYAYDKLKQVVEFLLRSFGSDLRSKGPSIARGELAMLLSETRILQSILGVYAFFLDRERIIRRLFEENNIPFTGSLEFEPLAQAFINLVDERYPTAAKIYTAGRQLGIQDDILAQIIVFTQCRDAIREVAPRVYRSLKHRFELLMAIIETLEELEDKLEEEEEE